MNKLLVSGLAFGLVSMVASASFANENVFEKLMSAANSEYRQMEKGSHRMQEMLCFEGTVTCAAKKAANRAKEAGTFIGDGVAEVKNKID